MVRGWGLSAIYFSVPTDRDVVLGGDAHQQPSELSLPYPYCSIQR